MGIDCHLYIGSTSLSWRNAIPDVIGLLFEAEDYIAILNEEEEWYEQKLVSSCGKAANQFQNFGIDLEFIRRLHFSYFAFDFDEYKRSLDYRCEQYLQKKYGDRGNLKNQTDRMVQLFLNYFCLLDSDEEFLKVLDDHKCSGNYFDYLGELRNALERPEKEQTVKQGEITFDLFEFSRSYLKEFLAEDPYLRHLTEDFSYRQTGSFDLDLIYDIGLSVFASSSDIPIEFHFTEFTEATSILPTTEVEELIDELRTSLQNRSLFAASAFGQLDKKSRQTLLPFISNPLEKAMVQSAKERGDLLENLASTLFKSQKGFLVKQNVRRSHEELDLVIVNKIDDPFWAGLQSPIILVECKNQRGKVEAKDLRNFEVKILDRKDICRFGIIISTSGFTRGCFEAASRCSRDGYRIILVDSNALQRRIEGSISTTEWLEQIILEQL